MVCLPETSARPHGGWLTLEPGQAKSKEARTFPVDMVPRLRNALAKQLERVAAMERSMGKVILWLFPGPTGDRIRDPHGLAKRVRQGRHSERDTARL
jgi:hypothetical protein